jgi:hypothetical protein
MSKDISQPPKSLSRTACAMLLVLLATLAGSRASGQPGPGPGAGFDPARNELTHRARVAGIPPDAFDDLMLRGRNAGFSDRQLAALGNRVLGICDQGLPCLLVLDRVRQGIAKGAPYDRIESACDRIENRLREGASLVDRAFPELAGARGDRTRDPGPGPGERLALIDQTAFALEKGVPPASVEAIFGSLRVAGPAPVQARAVVPPLIAMTSLVSEGVPPGPCLAFITEACRSGVCGPDLTGLSLAMAQAMRAGGRDEILHQVLDGLRRRVPPGEIIRELPGGRPGHRLRPPPPGPPGPDGGRPGARPGGARPPDDPGRRGGHGEGRRGDPHGKG